MTTEVCDGVFNFCLKPENEEVLNDPELIPMFISALEKFSCEINIKNLSGFKLRGTNIMMQTFHYEIFTVTLFMNANVNFKPFKEEMDEWFEKIFNNHNKEFEKSVIIGDVSKLQHLIVDGRKWLNELNQKYEKMAINLKIFDFQQATDLYEKMQIIYRDYQFKYSIYLKKINKLKENFMKAFYNENFIEIREIAKSVKNLKV